MRDDAESRSLGPVYAPLVFAVCLLLWLLLAGSLSRDEWIAGGVVAASVTGLFASRLTIFRGFRFRWLAPWYILCYLGGFFVDLVVANVQLALRILNPSLPIRPRIVEVRTGLRSPLGRLLLANSITLTPGTLTVDVQEDRLLVHWVYCPPGSDHASATECIAAATERRLARFLK